MLLWFVFPALHTGRDSGRKALFTDQGLLAGWATSSGSLKGCWPFEAFSCTFEIYVCITSIAHFLLLKTKPNKERKKDQKKKKKAGTQFTFTLEEVEDTLALVSVWNSCGCCSWCIAWRKLSVCWLPPEFPSLTRGLCCSLCWVLFKLGKGKVTGFPEYFAFHSRIPFSHSSISSSYIPKGHLSYIGRDLWLHFCEWMSLCGKRLEAWGFLTPIFGCSLGIGHWSP